MTHAGNKNFFHFILKFGLEDSAKQDKKLTPLDT